MTTTTIIIAVAILIVGIIAIKYLKRTAKQSDAKNGDEAYQLIINQLTTTKELLSIVEAPQLVYRQNNKDIYIATYLKNQINIGYLAIFEKETQGKLKLRCVNGSILNQKTAQSEIKNNYTLVAPNAENQPQGIFRLQSNDIENPLTYSLQIAEDSSSNISVELIEAIKIGVDLSPAIKKTVYKQDAESRRKQISIDRFRDYTLPLIDTLVESETVNLLERCKTWFDAENIFKLNNDSKNGLTITHYQIIREAINNAVENARADSENMDRYYEDDVEIKQNKPAITYSFSEILLKELSAETLSVELISRTDKAEIIFEIGDNDFDLRVEPISLIINSEEIIHPLSANISKNLFWQKGWLSKISPIHALYIIYNLPTDSRIQNIFEADINNDGKQEYIVTVLQYDISIHQESRIDFYFFAIENDFDLHYLGTDTLGKYNMLYDSEILTIDRLFYSWERSVGNNNYIFSYANLYASEDEGNASQSIRLYFDNDLHIKIIDEWSTGYSEYEKTYIRTSIENEDEKIYTPTLSEEQILEYTSGCDALETGITTKYQNNSLVDLNVTLYTEDGEASYIEKRQERKAYLFEYTKYESAIDILSYYTERKNAQIAKHIKEEVAANYNLDWFVDYIISDKYSIEQKLVFGLIIYNPYFETRFNENYYKILDLFVEEKQIDMAYTLFLLCRENNSNDIWRYTETYYWAAYLAYADKQYTKAKEYLNDYMLKCKEQDIAPCNKAVELTDNLAQN